MSHAYDRCITHAKEHKNALEIKLNETELDDLVAHYESVAKAFPSKSPNEYSLDIPLIDDVALSSWARDKGWKVSLAPEMSSSEVQGMPPVRFTRASRKLGPKTGTDLFKAD
ncbi:MAG: hypothetical protein LC687_01845 [Actinobacteria bacterium]|nr:hypothetical protein [Actinomycetota bacterium]